MNLPQLTILPRHFVANRNPGQPAPPGVPSPNGDPGSPTGANSPPAAPAPATDGQSQPAAGQDDALNRTTDFLAGMIVSVLGPEHAAFGDAVYTQEAMDRVVSAFMEAAATAGGGHDGAPPATEAAIEKLEMKPLDEKMMEDGRTRCTICIEVGFISLLISAPFSPFVKPLANLRNNSTFCACMPS
jgi:E3 ubiquitin-protein ligase RNF115/126